MKRALCSFSLVFGVCGFLAGLQTANADTVSHLGAVDPTTEAWTQVELAAGRPGTVEGVTDTVGPTDAWHLQNLGNMPNDGYGGSYYTFTNTAGTESLAHANGWTYSTKVRLLDPNQAVGSWGMFFEADDGHRDFVLNLGTTANGDPIVAWLYGANAGQQTLTGGAGAYHTYAIRFDPAALGSASVYADNNLLVSGWTGVATNEPYGLAWGAGTNGAASNANFAEVHFNVVPEPTAIVMLLTGLIGVLVFAWRKRG